MRKFKKKIIVASYLHFLPDYGANGLKEVKEIKLKFVFFYPLQIIVSFIVAKKFYCQNICFKNIRYTNKLLRFRKKGMEIMGTNGKKKGTTT
jgi:hypothetical protein